jgi:hypothetical protein
MYQTVSTQTESTREKEKKQVKTITKSVYPVFAAFVLACFCPFAHGAGLNPPPDGGYPGGNTAEGQNALFNLTAGTYNTAVGLFSLGAVTTGNFNTGVGAGALFLTTGDQNTATGAGALLNNNVGSFNTANGAFALVNQTTGGSNTAIGAGALGTTTGGSNTAVGVNALFHNNLGNNNTAVGASALVNAIGSGNTAVGIGAGSNVTAASNVICIGALGQNVSDSCYIGEIFGRSSPDGAPVLINSDNKLGTFTSSKRFKEDIKPMDKASEAILALKPVTFRYKKEIDPTGRSQFGLVAEEVEKVNPDLVVRDKEGKPYSVRYEQVNAMLLNEFLKEHRKVQEQEATIMELKSTAGKQQATIAQQQREFQTNAARRENEIQALTARLKHQAAQVQKMSAQLPSANPSSGGLQLNNPAPKQVVLKIP